MWDVRLGPHLQWSVIHDDSTAGMWAVPDEAPPGSCPRGVLPTVHLVLRRGPLSPLHISPSPTTTTTLISSGERPFWKIRTSSRRLSASGRWLVLGESGGLCPAAELHGVDHAVDGYHIGRIAHVHVLVLRHVQDGLEGAGHLFVQPGQHVLARPVEVHVVLDALEVGGGHPPGVAQEVGDVEDAALL